MAGGAEEGAICEGVEVGEADGGWAGEDFVLRVDEAGVRWF